MAMMKVEAEESIVADEGVAEVAQLESAQPAPPPPGEGQDGSDAQPLRTDFSETAFWEPHLLLGDGGSVEFEFTVPDSVTEWNLWAHALTRDLRAGQVQERVRTVKELLVRPYLPRFLREGDRADLKVVVNNAGAETLSGTLDLDLHDPATEADLSAAFGLEPAAIRDVPFVVEPGGSQALTFTVRAPVKVGEAALRVSGSAGDWSDGELRPLPVLPGRIHLAQSQFAALSGTDQREFDFSALTGAGDPTRIDEQLVVTLDAQLFYSVLHAVPYLVNYPYECTEQTLNRFLSTGILARLYDDYPAVQKMAEKFADRDTQLESWQEDDPNRVLGLEETPWLIESRGGGISEEALIKVLDPRIANAQRRAALVELERVQTAGGGFPWWPGGPPSPYMTAYIVAGFARALEFGVEVPKEPIVKAWGYLHRYFEEELSPKMEDGESGDWRLVTLLNYLLSSYPDVSWTGGVFSDEQRQRMLDFSFAHWQQHAPRLKGYLALTLGRADRMDDARLVFDAVMDSALTDRDLGTYWAPEERAWLWYNDTIESHAFALRVLTELYPDDERRHGLVHWLMLNKKLNHWKSTRATAEVLYALVHYLEREGTLAVREEAEVAVGIRSYEFAFEPDEYTGRNRQIVLGGEEIDPASDAKIVVGKDTPGLLFASATWHFSTEQMPAEAQGDLFAVTRQVFKRTLVGDAWRLEPLAEGASVAVGDQLEVQLSVRAKHAAEYVHLRDPRPAGFEPETVRSGYQWGLGVGWYEEIRDSGANFFFEHLPAGEYTLKYRLRANLAGEFQAAPAVLQSMYAPEFTAYSAGRRMSITP